MLRTRGAHQHKRYSRSDIYTVEASAHVKPTLEDERKLKQMERSVEKNADSSSCKRWISHYFVRKKKNTREAHNYERSSRKDNVSIMLVDFVTSVSRMTGKNMQGLSLSLNTQNGIKAVYLNFFYWPAEITGLKYKTCCQSKGSRREEKTLMIL